MIDSKIHAKTYSKEIKEIRNEIGLLASIGELVFDLFCNDFVRNGYQIWIC